MYKSPPSIVSQRETLFCLGFPSGTSYNWVLNGGTNHCGFSENETCSEWRKSYLDQRFGCSIRSIIVEPRVSDAFAFKSATNSFSRKGTCQTTER